ncbi:3584_t:CDS:2 [Diversispora eburnea]|uniref:3584_t:CDS:1 n=1 Tax=Diversispora eburnea TaxID=1213867 RepID=A0A9N9FGD8_9GLOM|nr:3584_t:CDS:2 [Diversispora eburnea]
MTTSLAQFLEDTSSDEQSIKIIHSNIERIQTLQNQILASTSLQQEASQGEERNGLLVNTKDLLFQMKDRIRKIESENARLPATDSNLTVRKQRIELIRERFTDVLEKYRAVQDSYINQQKDRMSRQYRVVNPDASEQEIENYLSDPSGQPFQQALLRTDKAKDAMAYVQQRHGDIILIEQTIAELAQLFNEMQLQVEVQDTVLTEIDEKVQIVTEDTEKGADHVGRAYELALAARKKKWMTIGIVVAFSSIKQS